MFYRRLNDNNDTYKREVSNHMRIARNRNKPASYHGVKKKTFLLLHHDHAYEMNAA